MLPARRKPMVGVTWTICVETVVGITLEYDCTKIGRVHTVVYTNYLEFTLSDGNFSDGQDNLFTV